MGSKKFTEAFEIPTFKTFLGTKLVTLSSEHPVDGVNFDNFFKCKTIGKIHLLRCQILAFNPNCFVGLEVQSLVTLQM